ncbi:MAG TPA: hypothetical protein VFV50_00715 [Bdellovibrionales bacterium]|nr:hypothetical protein [Bdellovibrionales bacterium]
MKNKFAFILVLALAAPALAETTNGNGFYCSKPSTDGELAVASFAPTEKGGSVGVAIAKLPHGEAQIATKAVRGWSGSVHVVQARSLILQGPGNGLREIRIIDGGTIKETFDFISDCKTF